MSGENFEQFSGVICSHSRGLYVVIAAGKEYNCCIKGSLFDEDGRLIQLTVGDNVSVRYSSNDKQGMIVGLQERSSVYQRRIKYKDKPQLIAANADLIAIVVSLTNPEFHIGICTRFLLAAALGTIEPFVIINKIDLNPAEDVAQLTKLFADCNVPVLFHSKYDDSTLPELKKRFKNKTVILAGLSGVGKSSLINHLMPQLKLRTDSLISKIERGRHTTTLTKMFLSEGKLSIIDTPGVQKFTPFVNDAKQLSNSFRAFSSFDNDCKFTNCSHIDEQDCSVKAAVYKGKISSTWYQEYCKIHQDISSYLMRTKSYG